MVKLSVIVIARNEEAMIGDALKSVRWADEVIVIDTGSIDKTIEISKKLGAKVFKYEKKGSFSDWRNFGLKKALCDWVFYLDADERVDISLKREIQKVVNNPNYFGYAIPRSNVILGREFRHGGFWPDYVKRLFFRDKLKGWEGELHEEPKIEGNLGHLENPLKHIKHETFSEMVEKTNEWSEIEAKLLYRAGHPRMNVLRFMSVMLREFWLRMVLGRAFLDGAEGVMFAMYQVYSRFVSYAKLWELQISQDKNK